MAMPLLTACQSLSVAGKPRVGNDGDKDAEKYSRVAANPPRAYYESTRLIVEKTFAVKFELPCKKILSSLASMCIEDQSYGGRAY